MKKANMTQDEIKKMRRSSYIKLVAMVGFVAAVLAYGTISWFTQNKENSASGIGVSTKTISFKLKSKGDIAQDSDKKTLFNTIFSSAATEFKNGLTSDDTFFYTGTENDNIKWRMESDDQGLEPGAFGELTFWVVPDKNNTSLDMEFTVKMRGFTKTGGTWVESADATTLGYLNSHVLFFERRYSAGTEYSYSDLINPDFKKLALTETDPVTIYWVWPNTFKQMMYEDGATELGTARGIAYDTNTLTDIKSYVSYNKAKMFPVSTANLDTHVSNCCGSTAATEDKVASIAVLDTAYNTADTAIGSLLRGALTELTANAIQEHEITTP